jgi:hypothetical protein
LVDFNEIVLEAKNAAETATKKKTRRSRSKSYSVSPAPVAAATPVVEEATEIGHDPEVDVLEEKAGE